MVRLETSLLIESDTRTQGTSSSSETFPGEYLSSKHREMSGGMTGQVFLEARGVKRGL